MEKNLILMLAEDPSSFASNLKKHTKNFINKYISSKKPFVIENQNIKVKDMTGKLAYMYGFKNNELGEKAYNRAMTKRYLATLKQWPGPFAHRTNMHAFRPIVDALDLDYLQSLIKDFIKKYLKLYLDKNKIRVVLHRRGPLVISNNLTTDPLVTKVLLENSEPGKMFKDQYGNINNSIFYNRYRAQLNGSRLNTPLYNPDFSSTVNIYSEGNADLLKLKKKVLKAYKKPFSVNGVRRHLIGHAATGWYVTPNRDVPMKDFDFDLLLPFEKIKNPRKGYVVEFPLRYTAMHQGKALYSNYTNKEHPDSYADYINFLKSLPRNEKGFITEKYYDLGSDPFSAMQDDLVEYYDAVVAALKDLEKKLKHIIDKKTDPKLSLTDKWNREAIIRHLLLNIQRYKQILNRFQHLWLQASLWTPNKQIQYG